MNRTFLLFEDGSHYTVFCTPYPMPPGTSRPVDAYILTEPLGDFTVAAQKAVHAVFSAALERNLRLDPVNAGFDLAERVGREADITGQSGGLAFAVAFAGQVLETDSGRVAATGEVQGDGRITGVAGIEKKLTTALDLLSAGDTLLFPRENLDDIPASLMTRLREKRITPMAVSRMDEVIDVLLGERRAPTKGSRLRRVLLIVLLLAALALAALEFYSGKGPDTPDPVFKTEAPLPKREDPRDIRKASPVLPPEAPEEQEKPEKIENTQVIDITPAVSKEKRSPVLAPDNPEPETPPKEEVSLPKPARPEPAVTPPLPPPGPEGDKGFE
ncbi:MAG TPA: hypothetical protein DHV36_24685 [Desulfobacteraceae bacterium]|nr:hypothetical protein [Desulfobacteraceae bacterium]